MNMAWDLGWLQWGLGIVRITELRMLNMMLVLYFTMIQIWAGESRGVSFDGKNIKHIILKYEQQLTTREQSNEN